MTLAGAIGYHPLIDARETEPSTEPRIVAATSRHLPAIATIYAAVVETSAATFDLEAPGLRYWEDVLVHCSPKRGHHLLVALDRGGEVFAYAKSGMFKERAAYLTTVETSIYVAEQARGRGVAKRLYGQLFELLDASALQLAVAGIAEPNPASTALHRGFGFEPVGTFTGIGEKFGRLWDVTWYERRLGAGRPLPPRHRRDLRVSRRP